jgi:hypothetical protein
MLYVCVCVCVCVCVYVYTLLFSVSEPFVWTSWNAAWTPCCSKQHQRRKCWFLPYFLVWPLLPTHCRCRGLSSLTLTQSVGLLWTSDRPVAETSYWQHTILTTDSHLCLRRDSNARPETQATDRAATRICVIFNFLCFVIRNLTDVGLQEADVSVVFR